MASYVIRRLLIGALVLFLVSVIVFLLVRLLPGDPLTAFVGEGELGTLTPESRALLMARFGLDKSLTMQYVDWVTGLFRGDLGQSIAHGQDISSLVAYSLPITAHVGALSLMIIVFFGITFGVICALKRGTWIDTVLTLLANLGITMPSFWLGILSIYFFSLLLGWLPTSGYTSPFEDFWLSTRQLILPVMVIASTGMAGLVRLGRTVMLEVMMQDYVRTAWAKGLRERVIIVRHELKNAMIPIITVLGMMIGMVFSGSVIVETIFNIPGMGRLTVTALFDKDYQVVQFSVLMMGAIIILSNLIVDISYGWFDPRIRLN